MTSLPIHHSEHGIDAIITKVTPTGEKLFNMRDGKPYVVEGKLKVNLNDSNVHLIDEAKFTDAKGRQLKPEDMNLDTVVRIAAVILKGSQVLVFHRIKQDHEYFVFPGGHQGTKETALETLVREVSEETGLTMMPDQAELFIELTKEGFGIEKFYLVRGIADFSKLKKANPDGNPDEKNSSLWMDIDEAVERENVFPREVVEKLRYVASQPS
ncbi:MAG: NUDIX hydrolase [Candidatus Dojkabacteria bacterium]